MATIEKEKALDVVRQMVADGQVSQEVAEKYFPELKESEGEKIRKHLITLFTEEYGKNSSARFAGIKVKDIIAWLEKQGKQKPTNKEPIVVRDFYSVFSREQVEEIDKRIEESQRLYNAKLRDEMRKVKDFPMTD